MNEKQRPVDRAMAEERSEKRTMRCLWVNEVKSAAVRYPNSEVPWYLTLSGGEGGDIQLLIDKGLIRLTEVKSIDEKDQDKIVAVENNVQAIAKLQRRFTGLRIRQVNIQALVRGLSNYSWPRGRDVGYCRAHVVNLDLNESFRGTMENKAANFPVLTLVHKLCRLHEKPPQLDWTLCLTLHGEFKWNDGVSEWTNQFLVSNLNRESHFARNCEKFLGGDLFSQISSGEILDFRTLDRTSQQKIIMIIVPKYISNLVHNWGWSVFTNRNLRYVNEKHAPMVTWILKFTWSGQATSQPDTVYRSSLMDIFSGAGIVKDSGEIETTIY